MPKHFIESYERFYEKLNKLCKLADTRVNHTGVLAVSNYLGSSLAAGILTFVLNSLYGFNYAKINICSHFIHKIYLTMPNLLPHWQRRLCFWWCWFVCLFVCLWTTLLKKL